MKKYIVVFFVTCFLSLFGRAIASTNLELKSNKENNLILLQNKKMTPDYGDYYGYADFFYIPTGESVYSSSTYKIEMNINGNLVQLNEGSLDDSGGISVFRYPRHGKKNEEIVLISLIDLMLEIPREKHTVYLYKKGKLLYLGGFGGAVTSIDDYNLLAKDNMLPKEPVDYFSNLTVIDKTNKITIYSQSKYGESCSVNSFDL